MRLGEALEIVARDAGETHRHVRLLCGFEPLHFATFLKAHLGLRFPHNRVSVRPGLFGDLEGNIARAGQERAADGAIAIVEWPDLDPRLGFRSSSGWSMSTLDDILVQVTDKSKRLLGSLRSLATRMPVTIVGPTLGLPPLTHLPPAKTSLFELKLSAVLLDLLQEAASAPSLAILNAAVLAVESPQAARHDVKMDLQAGFPYTLTHADALAQLAVRCLFPSLAKKGLITDLDQTLWKGILGDAGVDGVSWSLEGKSQAHALYQQTLAALTESGVLLAIASKNDPQLVEVALARPDLLLSPTRIFPVEASWGTKSDAIDRILKTWNVNADSVVFVDDSPMELVEVAEKHPGLECLLFPSGDPAGIVSLLRELRLRFGKDEVREEDSLRLESLRAAAVAAREEVEAPSDDFITRLDARLTFEDADGTNARVFELVNKTNQFNLNGKRYTEAEWKLLRARPDDFLLVISYADRFGPLGRIAALSGIKQGDRCTVDTWVMSCRAFSRQIEFATLQFLFSRLPADEIRFAFRPTERNGPLQQFFDRFVMGTAPGGELTLRADAFQESCPNLFHEVMDHWIKSKPDSLTVSR